MGLKLGFLLISFLNLRNPKVIIFKNNINTTYKIHNNCIYINDSISNLDFNDYIILEKGNSYSYYRVVDKYLSYKDVLDNELLISDNNIYLKATLTGKMLKK